MSHDRLMVVSVAGFVVNLIGLFAFQHGGAGREEGERERERGGGVRGREGGREGERGGGGVRGREGEREREGGGVRGREGERERQREWG